MDNPVIISDATLYHADCRDILPTLEGVDCVVTDPPYNVGYSYESYDDSLSEEDYKRLIGTFSPYPCAFIHYPESLPLISLALEEPPRKVVAWVYNANTPRQWRIVAWFGITPDFTAIGQPYKNPNDKRIRQRIANGEMGRLYDWWEISQVKNVSAEKTEHPCQMPDEVMYRAVAITPAETILDPFMGSGTTGVACARLGRQFIGIEIEKKYFDIACERIDREYSQGKLFNG
jgi:DNA modification methylase